MDTYEKKYKEALLKARDARQNTESAVTIGILEEIFPELKESEDEKIRKSIHIYLDWLDGRKDYAPRGEYTIRDMMSWLEKQGEPYGQRKECLDCQFNYAGECKGSCQMKRGEQKSADKVEPKFKVGEWITHNTANFVFKIINVGSNGYEVVNSVNYKKTISFDNEDKYHLWTIQDAKDGDVLLFEGYYNSIVLFQGIGINGKGRINYHCKCDLGNYSFGVQGDVACLGTIEKDLEHYHPATKEHRELLFKKMHEAGYTFDFDKKELKKIEQKPAWSKEDERICQCLIEDQEESLNKVEVISNLKKMYEERIDWLKSLKERIGG